MSEKKRERIRKQVDNPTEPKTHEKKSGKQTKFVIDVGDLVATPEQVEEIKSSLVRHTIDQLRNYELAGGGKFERPNVGVEFFSLSFSMSFSLGA